MSSTINYMFLMMLLLLLLVYYKGLKEFIDIFTGASIKTITFLQGK